MHDCVNGRCQWLHGRRLRRLLLTVGWDVLLILCFKIGVRKKMVVFAETGCKLDDHKR